MNFTVDMIEGKYGILSDKNKKILNIPLKDLPEDVKVKDILTIINGAFEYYNK